MRTEKIFSSRNGEFAEVECLVNGRPFTKEGFFELFNSQEYVEFRRFIGEMDRVKIFEIDKLYTENVGPLRKYTVISTSSATYFIGTDYDRERNGECKISVGDEYISVFCHSTIKAMG